ncbi:UNC93-like protein isoform X2 [Amphibalanus amphitrite]|uniref:UNC93-like protein isoform X1 n=1 Tax=Amphibalanus amphitrite TaxID=1232801 RepID=UPI001C90E81F|nr:UNC93-like protein isoform X1 [Amphibalanus amphitrite]XP_043230218.1 UNC93-like protein isoform X2 [Amphibalanus amphitrite]
MGKGNDFQYDNSSYIGEKNGDLPSKEVTASSSTTSVTASDPERSSSGPQTPGAGHLTRADRWRIIKNVVAISFSFMCLFTAFQSMSNLQSSINSEAGLGTKSLATIYVALIVSCMFLPSLVIKKLTCKWAMVVCTFCYSLYMLAQFYPRSYTMIPAAIILGFGAAPMWSAKCTYLTQVGKIYAEIIEDASEPIIVKFFGIFFLLFQSSQIWGNLISSMVLNPGQGAGVEPPSEESLSICGINYCPGAESAGGSAVNNTNLERPDEVRIYTLAGIFLGLAVLSSVLISILVDSLDRYGEKERTNNQGEKSPLQLLLATFVHLKKPYQILIVPLTLWSGFEQGFITADFTKAYVSCAWGIHRVGLVMITYGVCDAICSFSFGFVIKRIGRVPIFVFGALINYGVIIAFIHWMPRPDESHVFFLLAAAWGIADAVWQTQINAFYGVIFPHTSEAAFSNYRLWESLGFAISFIYSDMLCVDVKIYILLVVLTLGMIGYLTIEVLERKRCKTLSITKE